MPLRQAQTQCDAVAMPDRPLPAVDALIRPVQGVAANRPDSTHILAQTISETGADPYAVRVLVKGAVLIILQHVPEERRVETALTLVHLLEERLTARGRR
jgi:hypothetical protein